MTLFELVGTAATSIFAGGATGLVGMGLQRLFDWLKVKQDLQLFQAKAAHELLMRDKDALLMDKEWQGRLRVAQTEGELKVDAVNGQAFAESLLREPERYSNVATLSWGQQWIMVALDFIRGIIRPFLTAYLCVFVTYVWFQVKFLLAVEELEAKDILEIWRLVVGTILYLWTTVTLWWFGTRNKESGPSLAGLANRGQ
jgi:hypothetical protein